ncbi:MAG: PKD domain-containing protein [bacterium]|nr:PKD domain-containing protein [bacterium]
MKFVIAILLLMTFTPARASHIVGGDIYYDYLGNNQYLFTINLYRDCNSTGAQFDNPLSLGVFNSSGSLIQDIPVTYPGSQQIPVVFNNPCVIPPNNICTELASYQVTLTLPPIPGGYYVSYQRCCRGPNITNLSNPDDTGITLTTHIPGSDTGNQVNSSPRFNNYPPLLLCNNEDLIFDHSATDPDGDQLVYALTTPNSGATSFAPAPSPPPPPPYAPVVWAGAGFSAAQPLGPGSSITINPNTGLLQASPNLTGLFVVGIEVQEWRNGVLMNRTVRDFLFRVFNCQLSMEAILPLQTDLSTFVSYCQGLTVQFENDSYGGTNYYWDFGDPTTTNDNSTAFAPTYTYPTPGNYQVMLVVNPGWPCTDTAYMDVYVNTEYEVEWSTPLDSQCIIGNSFDFAASTTAGQNLDYTWDFGPNATPSTGTGTTVNNVSFSTPGMHIITVSGEANLCEDDFVDTVFLLEEPVAGIIVPDQVECEGLTISFGNSSIDATMYSWDFGETQISSDTSDLFAPTYTYTGPGTYTISLTASSGGACTNTATQEVTINDPILVSIAAPTSVCFTGNSVDFDGTMSGPPGTEFTWNFGPNASITTSQAEDVNGVEFSTMGEVEITLTGVFEQCEETATHDLYIYSPPTVDFTIAPGLQCAPFTAQFIDLSWAETPISYYWEFGDGTTSTDQNPSHLYEFVGNYPVTLTITTDAGCVDTLSLLQADLVNVRPIPEAGFSVTPDFTDICNSEVQMIDESVGAVEYFYWYDDSTIFYMGENPNPVHQYLYDGTHYPMQVVTNEWGCKDTAYSELYIEPWSVFIPNTFTPDGDEFNNVFVAEHWLDVSEWEMRVYNRWGQVIFESFDSSVGWDGTFNGKYVQDGTYGYTLRYKTCEPLNPDHFITGHINVLR